jgi:hypothetical protein
LSPEKIVCQKKPFWKAATMAKKFFGAPETSGYSGDPAMIDPEAHGFAGRLAKPYTVLELEDVVTRVLGGEGL